METLSDYGIHVKASSGTAKTTCPQCSHKRKKKSDPCLSVNIDKGVWNCHNCGWSGGLKDNESQNTPPSSSKTKAGLNTQPLTPDAVKWLEERGISRETAEEFTVKSCMHWFPRLDRKGAAVAIPFHRDGGVKNVKIRSIESKAFAQYKGGAQILFNFDGCRDRNTIAITEGELDAMAIYESGFEGGVCSCPNGAPSPGTNNLSKKLEFIEDAREVFDTAETVILAMDSDQAGIPWAQAIADKIGLHKCRLVEWSRECKDANDVLKMHGGKMLIECLENAAPYPVPGIVTFQEVENEIWQYYDEGGAAKGYSTGWPSLDRLIRIDTKTLNIVTGIPSSGKSELLDQLMLNTVKEHGWKWGIFSPENYPLQNHFQKLAEKWTGKPMFDRWSMQAMSGSEVSETIATLSESVINLTFGEKPASLDELLTRLKVCKMRYGIKGAIIDPYNEIDRMGGEVQRETEFIERMLTTIRNFGRLNDVAMFVVAHPTKLQKLESGEYPIPTPYDIKGSSTWRDKADIVFSVWRSLKDNSNRPELHVQKVRNKNLGQCGSVTFRWCRANGVFYETSAVDGADVAQMRGHAGGDCSGHNADGDGVS